MPRVLEQGLGLLLTLFILSDIFFTVLYARIGSKGLSRFGTGILSAQIARYTWKAFRAVAVRTGSRKGPILTFVGPLVLVLLVFTWTAGLALGGALVIHPALGTGMQVSIGQTPRNFLSAFYAAGISLSVIGSSDFKPQTDAYRLYYFFNSMVGASSLSLTLTYLMQVYSALRERNALGVKLHFLSAETADAAELLAGLAPEGNFESAYGLVTDIAAEVVTVKEAHHFYPVLFYFRFTESYYSVAQVALLTLDFVSLAKTALADEEGSWFRESAGLSLLWRSSLTVTRKLEGAFLPGQEADEARAPDMQTLDHWRRRHAAAMRRLTQAGIETREDAERAADEYVVMRREWDRHTRALAEAMAFDLGEIDPIGTHPELSDLRTPFRVRRRVVQ